MQNLDGHWQDKTAAVTDSQCQVSTKVYAHASVVRSVLGEMVTIGDSSTVIDSRAEGCNSVNRRNYVIRSTLGRYSYTGINTQIRNAVIGRFCSISWNVSIGGGNHPLEHVTTFTKERLFGLSGEGATVEGRIASESRLASLGGCQIGNDVWIGTNAIVMDGCVVGNGAVIGAGAVVTRDVEPWAIVVGVPAKVLRFRFNETIIAALNQIEWWNWSDSTLRHNADLLFGRSVDSRVIGELQAVAHEEEARLRAMTQRRAIDGLGGRPGAIGDK